MKFFKKLALLPALCLVLLAFAGCAEQTYNFYTNIPQGSFTITDKNFICGAIGGYTATDREYEEVNTANYSSKRYIFFSMATDAELVVSADFTSELAVQDVTAFAQRVRERLNEIDGALSPSISASDVNKFNSAEAGATLEISKTAYEVLTLALDVYNLTEGYYNPALYYNVDAYYFGNYQIYPENKNQLPKDGDIAKYIELSRHFGELELTTEEGKYFVKKPEYTVTVGGETLAMKIDLGGIGKGYAVDEVDKLFDLFEYSFGYFSFGGSSMLVKSNLTNGNYNVQLRNPRSPSKDTYIDIPVRCEKLSTSGDNEQYYVIDGVRYCHIIDATTGKPVQTGIMSATVIGGSAAEDDALTTALMAMGKDKAIKFIEENLTDRRVVFTVE